MHAMLLYLVAEATIQPKPSGETGSDLSYLGWLCPLLVLLGVCIGLATWYGQRKARERVSTLESSLVDEVATRRGSGRPAETILPTAEVADRVHHAEAQLAALAKQDALADPTYLREWAKEVFLLVKRSWAARNYAPAQGVMSWGLYGQHLTLLKHLRAEHEVNRLDDLELERVELVDAATAGPVLACTALMTYRARNYIVDELTQAFRRGQRDCCQYQEFWTFQRQGDVWLVHNIEKSKGR